MTCPFSPPDESQRLAALHQYAVMDTLPERALDELTELASQLCETPLALISLVDERRQWFKARVGMELTETPREISFCAHALQQTGVLVVPNAVLDARFAQSPLVTGPEGIRFYAGAPLVAPGGEVLGTLCVMDRMPRELTPFQLRTLQVLSRQVVTQLELQRQQRELRESEERFFAFLQHNPAVTWIVDGDGRFCYVSPSFCAKFGGDEVEMVGKKLHDLFEPKFADEYMAGNRVVIEGKRTLETVDPGRRADGTIGQFLTVKFPIEAPIPLLGGMAIDITDLKKVEDALRVSEARFNAVFQSNPAAVGITVLATGKIVDANERLCEFVGRSREEMIGKTIFEIGLWVDLEKRKPLIEEVRKTGSVHNAEIQMRNNAGEVREALVSLERVEVKGEAEPLLVTMFVDVTERKLAEREARRTADLLQAVVSGTTDMIFVKDLEGRYLLYNDAAALFIGRPTEEILGLTDIQILPPEDARVVMASDRAVIESGHAHTVMETLVKTGTARTFMSLKAPYRDGEGRIIGVVGIARDITERQEAEQALRSQAEMLRATGRIAKVGGWEFETATGKGTWTEEMANIHDLDHNEKLNTEQAMGFYEGASRAQLEAAIKTAVAVGTPYDLELEFRSAKGHRKWVRTIGLPEVADGRVVKVRGAFQDITDRKQAEEQLRLLETGISRLNDIVLITEAEPQDEPGPRILYVNDAFVRHTGYSREEALGRTPRLLQGPKTSRAELDRIREAMRRWKPVRSELINYKKSGEEFWIELDMVPVADATGWFTHWVAVERDITERKRHEARFRRLIESNAQGVFFWNTKGEIWEGNDNFLQLTRYTREDLQAGLINWAEMTPPQYQAMDQRALQELTERGFCKPYEKEYIRKDGTHVPILLGATVFEDNPTEGVCFVVDLSEKKKLERQFFQAQRMESIGTLASGIAHDLNNVFAPILMSLRLLKMRYPEQESHELIDFVSDSARHGADMVSQVLSFSRGVEGRQIEVQVAHIVREIEKLATETFPKNIQVRTRVPMDLDIVMGDPTQIHQVLLNLAINARDAMPQGGMLSFTATNTVLDAHYAGLILDAEPGPYVLIEVGDTGTGMRPEIVEKIFDPFFTTKDIGKGTGLGLSTSLAIMKGHGGFLRVESEVGLGSIFKMYLPAQLVHRMEPVALEAAPPPRGNGELILVVDDEPAVRKVVKLTLENAGYEVLLAVDGADAIATFSKRGSEIAAVLTDMMMPLMDGTGTIQVLKKLDPTVAIIAASGLPTYGDPANLDRLGVKAFLAKPYTEEDLLITLKHVLCTD